MYKHPFDQVREFHETFGIVNGTTPALPEQKTRDLRIALLQEEFDEYLKGESENDLVQIADALGDVIYIALGTALSYGIPLDAVFNEIHRSNMSKLDENGKVIYREDGKVMKSALYTKPDIEMILRNPNDAELADEQPFADLYSGA